MYRQACEPKSCCGFSILYSLYDDIHVVENWVTIASPKLGASFHRFLFGLNGPVVVLAPYFSWSMDQANQKPIGGLVLLSQGGFSIHFKWRFTFARAGSGVSSLFTYFFFSSLDYFDRRFCLYNKLPNNTRRKFNRTERDSCCIDDKVEFR